MPLTSLKRRLAAGTAVTGLLVVTGVAPAWGQQAGASGQPTQSGQADQPGQLGVPGKGPTRPEALPGRRTQPGNTGQTGPLKEQAIEPGTGAPGARGAAGGVTDDELNTYVRARQQLERDDPSMTRAFETGDFSGRRDGIRAALRGSQMSVEEFVQLHQQVQSDPSLRARVEARSGTTAGTGVPPPAGGAEVPAGAQPGASPR